MNKYKYKSPFLCYFFISIISFFFSFCVFLYIIKYILNIARAIKKISVNKIRDFIFENYHKRIGFSKENSYYSMKRFKKRFIVACKQIIRKNT